MKSHRLKHGTIILFLALIFMGNANAMELGGTSVDVGVDAAVMNSYVWRGILLTDDPVFQPGVTVGCNNLSLNFWANMDLGDANDTKGDINEFDYTLEYDYSVRSFNLSAGVIHYTFPNTDFDPTTELFAGIGYEVIGNPSLTVYQDIGEAEGTYLSLGGGTSVPLGSLSSLDLSASLSFGSSGHNGFYYGSDEAGFTDILLSAGVPFGIGDQCEISPSLAFTSVIDSGIRDSYDSGDMNTSNIVYGITLSAGF